MATGIKWPRTIHPTEETTMVMPKPEPESSGYEKAKERYEEAKEAYQVALEDLASAHTETENARRTMVEAREAFLTALGNDKIEEES